MAQRFFNLVLLPRVRDDIAEYKRLNFHLYQALRKALFKPGAFMKGFLLPLCEVNSHYPAVFETVGTKKFWKCSHGTILFFSWVFFCKLEYSQWKTNMHIYLTWAVMWDCSVNKVTGYRLVNGGFVPSRVICFVSLCIDWFLGPLSLYPVGTSGEAAGV
jgi:hypothetical protein